MITDSLFIHLDSISQLQRTFSVLSSTDKTNTSNNAVINLAKIVTVADTETPLKIMLKVFYG